MGTVVLPVLFYTDFSLVVHFPYEDSTQEGLGREVKVGIMYQILLNRFVIDVRRKSDGEGDRKSSRYNMRVAADNLVWRVFKWFIQKLVSRLIEAKQTNFVSKYFL